MNHKVFQFEECHLLGCYCHVVLVRTDISKEHIASIIMVTRIGKLGTLAVTGNQSTLQVNKIHMA
jgi:hypothetical protein